MRIASFSLFRHRAPAVTAALLRHVLPVRHLPVLAAKRSAPNSNSNANNVSKKPQPNKNLLRAKQTFREYSSLAPVLSSNATPSLSQSQAIGMVAAAQANFMRVIVQSEPSKTVHKTREEPPRSLDEGSSRVGVELLCVVKAVLKNIKRRVLVGDKVLVGSIDWVDRRAMIENVFERSSLIIDPPVANVDHLVVLFSMDQPKLEPFTLTRFLVEAESTGIPLTLALNKVELVDEVVRILKLKLFSVFPPN